MEDWVRDFNTTYIHTNRYNVPSEIEGIHNLVPAESHLLILIDMKCLEEENALYLFIYTDIFKVPAGEPVGKAFYQYC